MPYAPINGHRLEYELLPGERGAPLLVFLHEGLGSVALWRDFPSRVVAATGHPALVYSRYGYGRSDPITRPRAVDFMHREALEALPALLDFLGASNPVLFGHSDGASIALIHAGAKVRPVSGLIVLAPHVLVEDVCISRIEAARLAYDRTDLPTKLARYHEDPESAFRGWSDVWLDPDFRAWSIEEYLPGVGCPVLAIQGKEDEYGTLDQLARIKAAVPQAELLVLDRCSHSPHRDRPEAVLEATVAFLAGLRP